MFETQYGRMLGGRNAPPGSLAAVDVGMRLDRDSVRAIQLGAQVEARAHSRSGSGPHPGFDNYGNAQYSRAYQALADAADYLLALMDRQRLGMQGGGNPANIEPFIERIGPGSVRAILDRNYPRSPVPPTISGTFSASDARNLARAIGGLGHGERLRGSGR